ncbi:MAG: hypothetical protein HS123_02015 [Solibacteraceae bacterium]|nr:hypothetical protein [Solibacteraceae bacterium]
MAAVSASKPTPSPSPSSTMNASDPNSSRSRPARPPDAFRLDPIYRKAMFVVRDGKPLVITYWCEVCAIRTYSPGRCQCCQDETAFDPRDPALEDQAR